ncbi:MAG: exodeoxyribonuclease III [Myxococcota bacterium]
MKVATWNVNGIRARAAQVQEWMAREQPDVVCLQEIKALPSQVPEALVQHPDYFGFWHGAGPYSGVSLMLRRGICQAEPCFVHPTFDVETRVVTAEVGNTVFASIYVPNGGKDYDAKITFLRALGDFAGATRASGKELVLCGDLNVARTDRDVHAKERKPGLIGQRPEERELFERILGHGLVDVGRAQEPDKEGLFTWWAPWRNMRQRNIGWRIDYVLASNAVAERITSCRVQADVGTSDHAPVVAQW